MFFFLSEKDLIIDIKLCDKYNPHFVKFYYVKRL